MKTRLTIKCCQLRKYAIGRSRQLIDGSCGLCFSPKKTIEAILQVIKEKKGMKKPNSNIRHYHVHYYPTQIQFVSEVLPKSYDIEEEYLEPVGWPYYGYKYSPERKAAYHGASDFWDQFYGASGYNDRISGIGWNYIA